MADMDPCGNEENAGFLPEYEDVNQFMQQTLKAVLQATKASNEMPSSGDDFDYYSSFPGFQEAMDIEGKRVLHMIQSVLKQQSVKVHLGSTSGAADVEDKLDLLMDANDQILERVGTWLDEASGIKKDDSSLVVAQATPKHQAAASWNKKSPGSGSKASPSFRLLSARNIQRPQLKFKDKVDNRNIPFVPCIREKWNAQKSLEESLQISTDVDAEDPKFLYPHPYKYEIDNLQYGPDQLSASQLQDKTSVDDSSATLVANEEDLDSLVQDLKQQTHIAVDLEHHSYRTFQGITCLLQLSTRSHDYLVDTLELRSELHRLNEVFTDPGIVKVFHGADSDIDWLQRDLGVYVVNMFDTGQAARVLGHARFSLAHLLQHYCDVVADKKYQLADWRIRPLPEELQRYAREDTHHLLYIYDRMKNELLERGNENKNLLHSVLHRSSQICLKVYRKPTFSEDGYKELYMKNKKVFNSRQMLALKEVFSWRDETARLEDESYGYVLPNHMLLQICDILPRERQGILACCNPIPPLVRQYLNEIFIIINKAREAPLEKLEPRRPQKPTPTKHQLVDMESLLHCPHDLAPTEPNTNKTLPTLLDSSLLPRTSGIPDSVFVTTSQPLLALFGTSSQPQSCISDVQKKVASIKASFASPYSQYLPEVGKNIRSPTKKVNLKSSTTVPETIAERAWKLLPKTAKRKSTEQQSTAEAPPAKRSRTDLHADTEKLELSQDDQRALPPDIEAPLRFQVSSEKKKSKKNRNRDVDILDSVKQHLANIRKLQEANEQPILGQETIDVDDDSAQNSSQTGAQPGESISQTGSKSSENKSQTGSKASETTMQTGSVSSGVTSGDSDCVIVDPSKKKKKVKKNRGEVTEVIDLDEEESNGNGAEFQPYDYTTAAKDVLQGKKSGPKLDYFNPQSGKGKGKGPKMSKKKGFSKQGKSFTWKS